MTNPSAKRISSPSLIKSFTEATRTGLELVAGQIGEKLIHRNTPEARHHPVLIVPGFMAGDWTTIALRNFLVRKGYPAYSWQGGINTGPSEKNLMHLEKRLHTIANYHPDEKVTLIGHSLGGIFAREMAREHPDLINQVITLGSPFAAGPHPKSVASVVRHAFSLINGDDHPFLVDSSLALQSMTPPPVPTTSIYSRGDGIVNWETCLNPDGHNFTENVEIWGSHCGMVANPLAFIVCADRLAIPRQKDWKPFDPEKYYAAFFPTVKPRFESAPAR